MNDHNGEATGLPGQAKGKEPIESELLWTTLVEMAGDGFEMVDEGGHYLQVNAASCAASGYTREELLRMTVFDIDPCLSLETFRTMFRAFLDGPAGTFETVHRRKDGTEFPAEVTAKVIQLSGRHVSLVQVRDISGRKRAEEEQKILQSQIEHLQRVESIGQLAGGVAHEINNVLASIMAVSELLRRQGGEAAPQAELILKASRHGRDIVKALLDFSRRDSNETTLLDLNEIVRRSVEVLSATTRQKIQVQQDLEPTLPMVLIEEGALSSAIMNLCLNAVDAMSDGGTITIRTRNLFAGFVQLAVEDTGHGMTEKVRVRAMEPFFTTKPFGKGKGLGLSTVYGLIRAHGGTMDIKSSPGVGTQVLLMFPPAPEQLATDDVPAVYPGSVSTKSLRILLVDDDELLREGVASLLRSMGHRAAVAAGGEEALRQLAEGLEVDCVILHLNMPGMDGEETLRRLRETHPRLPVVIGSVDTEPGRQERLLVFPFVTLLSKPYDLEDLEEALTHLLQ